MVTKKSKKPAAKKPAAKKPAAKKPAAKKPAAKKPSPKKPAAKKPSAKKSAAGDDRWWALIERSRKGTNGDGDAQADRLIELMTKELTADEVLAFDKFLGERIRDAFRSDLWAVAYIMNGGCSDDGFDYFIGWLICKGRKHYEASLKNPEDAAKGVDPDDEPFENEVVYYAPSRAWAAITGKPQDDYYALGSGVDRTLQGEDFDEDTVAEDHPRLAKKFGG